MKHYLDVSALSGYELEPVDIVTFGSPCQDLSVAGKRAGLKHETIGDKETTRSGLFMEAVRIIKEMRMATNGLHPTFALWENVPGAFSSNKGEDFRIVLEELAKIADETVSVPMPKKWTTAGYMEGDGWSIAWRTVDAQYAGVPQRRRRILLVADFAGGRAGEILFKCEGLPGYSAESSETGKETTADVRRSTISDDRLVGFDGYNGDITGNVTSTIGVNCGNSTERTGVINTVVFDARGNGDGNTVPTITGDHENRVTDYTAVCAYTMKIRSGKDGGGKGALVQANKSATLATNNDQYLFVPITEQT